MMKFYSDPSMSIRQKIDELYFLQVPFDTNTGIETDDHICSRII